jgi:hypothetical protein
LRREFDDEMLQEMASADGGMNQEGYYKGLREILRTGSVSCKVSDFEICNILRWGTLDLSVTLTPEKRRHEFTRLFGSWVLLNGYAHPERCENSQIETGDELALQMRSSLMLFLRHPNETVPQRVWLSGQRSKRLGSVKGKNPAGPGSWVTLVPEIGFDTGGFVKER